MITKRKILNEQDWEDIKTTAQSEADEDEILILAHRIIELPDGKKGHAVHTLLKTTDAKGGATLVELLINNAVQAGDLEGMILIAESMIRVGTAALQGIDRITRNQAKHN